MNKQKSFVDQLQIIWPVLSEASKDDITRATKGFSGDDYDEMCMRKMVNDDLYWVPVNGQTMLDEIQRSGSAYENGHRYLRKESDCWTAVRMKFIVDGTSKEIRLIAKITKAYNQGEECIPLEVIASRLGLDGWHMYSISGN